MGYESYFADVENELNARRRLNKQNGAILWMVLPLTFLFHAAVLTVIMKGAIWIFGNSPAVVGVTCAAYVSATLGWALNRIQQRSDQMALHATSVHDEVLLVKELIQDELRRNTR